MPAARQRGRSWSQDLGRYRSASSSAWKGPMATPTWTVMMPLSSLPTQPRYCGCTPGVGLAPLAATGLVDHAHGADGVRGAGRHRRSQVLLEAIPCPVVVPAGGDQEPLQGAHGGAGLQ